MTASARRRLGRLRLASQLIADPHVTAQSPADVVRHLGAMQAQDFLGAKWAVGLRLPGATEADVEASLADRTVVRSWPLRGTLHFVAAEDLGWMLSLSVDRLTRKSATTFAREGLTSPVMDRVREAVHSALVGGTSVSRDALYQVLADSGVSPVGQARYHAVWMLCQTGLLCLGAPDGKTQTFVLLDEWVRQPRVLQRDEALGELAARYFVGHGPSTVRDFAWWSGLTLTDARRGLDIARPQLERLVVDDVEYILSPQLRTEPAASRPRLLPGFDEYLLGYGDRSVALAEEHSPLVFPGKNGMFLSTIVVDGAVVGTWRRTTSATRVTVALRPFEPLTSDVRSAVEMAATEYARFLGLTLRMDA